MICTSGAIFNISYTGGDLILVFDCNMGSENVLEPIWGFQELSIRRLKAAPFISQHVLSCHFNNG